MCGWTRKTCVRVAAASVSRTKRPISSTTRRETNRLVSPTAKRVCRRDIPGNRRHTHQILPRSPPTHLTNLMTDTQLTKTPRRKVALSN